ncbi:MAG: shikimate kinase [Alphaproteobacteria bacterium]
MKVNKTITLVGLMGVGKSSIGWRLAKILGLPFFDSDQELEKAARCSVKEIYERWGKQAFEDAEKRVIKRLLSNPIHVLSTGDAAFLPEETRKLLKSQTLTIWLKADLDIIHERVSRRQTRPQLLTGDVLDTLKALEKERASIYSEADLLVESRHNSHDETVTLILEKLNIYFQELPHTKSQS